MKIRRHNQKTNIIKNFSFNILLIISFLTVFFTVSCSVEQKPIEYGHDKCDNCKMTIVDKKFAAEIVNNKGKAFKFDAAECMIRYIIGGKIKKENIAISLVTPYDRPGTLIDAKDCYFLISEKLPSPMGAFLSSYADKETAEKYRKQYDGTIYNWEEIIKEFSK